MLDNTSIDLVAVTETWFLSERPMDHCNIPGYELYSRPRTDRRGGGVALNVREHLCASLVNETNILEGVEELWVSLRPHRLPRNLSRIVVGVFYYQPNNPISTTLVDRIGYMVDSTLTR